MKIINLKPKKIPVFTFIVLGLLSIYAIVWLLPHIEANVLAAVDNPGPQLSIPDNIPAERNSLVNVPVSFAANGYQVSAVVFAIDYDQTWLYYDATVPNGIIMSLPAGFVGSCSPDLADTDGEIKCYVHYPFSPQQALNDRVLITVKLRTLNPAMSVSAKVGFSENNPPPSFGSTSGGNIPGETFDGSIAIYSSGGSYLLNLPVVLYHSGFIPTATPPGQCYELIQNGDFEYDGIWVLPATLYTARYSTLYAHQGSRSLQTGIVNISDQVYTYSSGYQYITIPSDANTARLSFWYYPISGDATSGKQSPKNLQLPRSKMVGDDLILEPSTEDWQYVIMYDENNNRLVDVLMTLSNSRTWTYHQYNLVQYRGRTLKLYIGTNNDGEGGVTAMFTDEVSVEICH